MATWVCRLRGDRVEDFKSQWSQPSNSENWEAEIDADDEVAARQLALKKFDGPIGPRRSGSQEPVESFTSEWFECRLKREAG